MFPAFLHANYRLDRKFLKVWLWRKFFCFSKSNQGFLAHAKCCRRCRRDGSGWGGVESVQTTFLVQFLKVPPPRHIQVKNTAQSGTFEHIRAHSGTFRSFDHWKTRVKRTRRHTFSATTPGLFIIKRDYIISWGCILARPPCHDLPL